jgi:hypothetical protein
MKLRSGFVKAKIFIERRKCIRPLNSLESVAYLVTVNFPYARGEVVTPFNDPVALNPVTFNVKGLRSQ